MKRSQIKWQYGLTEAMFWLLVEQNWIRQDSSTEFTLLLSDISNELKEELKKIIKQRKDEKIRQKHKERWANYSEEERTRVCQNISSGTKRAMHEPEIYNRMITGLHQVTDQIAQSVGRHWANMTDSEYESRCKAISKGLLNMDPETKEVSIELMKFSLKLLYSDEHYLEMHRARVKAGMTEEVCSYISKVTKEAMHRPETYAKTCKANKENAPKIGKTNEKFWSSETERYKQSLRCQEASCKGFKTKEQNGILSTSRAEDDFYTLLCSMFSTVERQKPYPNRASYHCDFYVKDIDTYIELNYYWEHGGCLYDENNPEHKEQLKYWQYRAKDTKSYARAIERWTKHDVYRWQLAQDAKINMLFIYPNNTKECIKLLQKMKKEIMNGKN